MTVRTRSNHKCFVFRIRRRYYEDIVSGKKKVEYRRDSPFWESRIVPGTVQSGKSLIALPISQKFIAVFICGKQVHRREITLIERIETPEYFSDQGKKDVDTATCFAFHLGKEVSL